MKRVKEFLKTEYRKKSLRVSENCLTTDEICSYVNKTVSLKEKKVLEAHLATCYNCLDNVVSIHDFNRSFTNKRRWELKKEIIFVIIAMICFISSFVISRFFLQFLAATIIFGMKWIVDSKTNRLLVMIYDAYKRGGEKEAGRIINKLEGGDNNDTRFKNRSGKNLSI